MKDHRLSFGKKGEDLACDYLRSQQCRILERRYRNCFGEIDIIACHHNTLLFIEVKTRHTATYGSPEEAVTFAKQRHIIRAAQGYLTDEAVPDAIEETRFDIIAIISADPPPVIDWIKGAFTAD